MRIHHSKPAKALKVPKESAHDNIDTVEDESEEMIEFDAEQLRTEIKELEGELLEHPMPSGYLSSDNVFSCFFVTQMVIF